MIRLPTFLLLLAGLAAAAQGQNTLSIEDAVRLALDTHPLLKERSEKAEGLNALVRQAAVAPNPRLILQSENWSFSGTPGQGVPTFTDQFLYFTQVIETAGKRQRRIELGRSSAALATLDRELLERQITARVKAAYWAARGNQRILELWRENQTNFIQTIRYHEDRARLGAIAEADLLKVRLESGRVSLAAAAATLEAERAQIALLREMGLPRFDPVQLTGELEIDSSADAPISIQDAIGSRIEAKIARQAVAEAEANLRLQRANSRPDVEVLGGYKRTEGFNTALWGLQLNLPVRNRNQGNIAAAERAVRAAQHSLSAAENQIRAEVLAAQMDLETRRLQLRALMAVSLEQADESVRIARAAYQEGGTDLLRLLDAERVHIELEVLNARTQMEYRQSLVALEAALGQSP